ncbi:hypothetical protein DPEC_G00345600 [Dallia pectoralis]|uniref:Uncharacterized protein n=1 Tax=Dallia pectoralis TaxID=75939 RepID=A0ACC2F3I9_DALPE|nr:hypothetical protein DPEC_G00345600 [Dallia pectoralis]
MYGCTKSRTTPYHPQGNGACERFNQTLLALLGSLRVEAQAQWEAALPALVQAYNNTVHGSTGFTPYFVLFGRHARLPVDLCLDVVPPQERRTLEGWVQAHHRTLTEAYAKVGAQSRRRQGWDQARYNKKARAVPLLAGERVLLRNFRRRAGGKLAPHWVPSPFVVVAQVQPGHPVYSIRPEGKNGPTRTIHRNNLHHCPAGVAFLAERQWFSDVSGENVIRPRQGSPPRKDPEERSGKDARGVEPDHDRLQRAQFIRALQPGSVQQELQREIRRRPAITFREVCTEAKALAYEIIGEMRGQAILLQGLSQLPPIRRSTRQMATPDITPAVDALLWQRTPPLAMKLTREYTAPMPHNPHCLLELDPCLQLSLRLIKTCRI